MGLTDMATLSTVLSRYGLFGRITANIEPHRDDQGKWGIKFSAPGDPAGVSIDLAGASKLAAELRGIAEAPLAERITGGSRFRQPRHRPFLPPPAGAGTSPSGSRTDRANLRVATLINIWFMAHLPSQSSATAASQLGTGRSFPSKPRVRRGPAKSRIAGVITGAEPRVGHQVAPEGHGSRPPLPCGLVTGPSLPLFNHLVGTGEQRRRHV